MIDVTQLTLKYPNNKGIEEVSFQVAEGEVLGYLGPNGAGKTTTIRCLLGFSNADRGIATINGLNCRKQAPKIQDFLGYIPGEIAFLDGMSGEQFLHFIAKMRGTQDKSRMKELMELFEIIPTGRIKKYSKGMKQKIGIIAAFMHDPKVIILDEPTSGLDPLMQNRFIELIISEKKRGKTILMSSHIFEEVERTCDRVAIIKDGKIIHESDVAALIQNQHKSYHFQLKNPTDIERLSAFGAEVVPLQGGKYEACIRGEQVDRFIKLLAGMELITFESKAQSLENVFLSLYGGGEKDEVSFVSGGCEK